VESLSFETKKLLGDFLIFGGIGIGSVGGLILLLILYFRLTRKYDAMFSEYYRIVPLASVMGTVVRTGLYAYMIIFKNLSKHKRHKITYEITNGYDFRGNAPRLDIILSYLYMFFTILLSGSLIVFIFLTEVFGIDL